MTTLTKIDPPPQMVNSPELGTTFLSILESESADSLLVALNRLDEGILNKPDLIPLWQSLVDRLIQLDAEKGRTYCADMSLYWTPAYAQEMIAEAQKEMTPADLESYTDFILTTQATGNTLDQLGTQKWTELTLQLPSKMGTYEAIRYICELFPKVVMAPGRFRTPYGLASASSISGGLNPANPNPRFKQKAAEVFLQLTDQLFNEDYKLGNSHVLDGINAIGLFLDEPAALHILEAWKRQVHTVARSHNSQEALACCQHAFIYNFCSHPVILTVTSQLAEQAAHAGHIPQAFRSYASIARHAKEDSSLRSNSLSFILNHYKEAPPWPTLSNLSEACASGLDEDDFILCLHAWKSVVDTLAKEDPSKVRDQVFRALEHDSPCKRRHIPTCMIAYLDMKVASSGKIASTEDCHPKKEYSYNPEKDWAHKTRKLALSNPYEALSKAVSHWSASVYYSPSTTKEAIDVWCYTVQELAKRDPSSVISKAFDSILPFFIPIEIDESKKDQATAFASRISSTFGIVLHEVEEQDPLLAMRICTNALKKEFHVFVAFCSNTFFSTIQQHMDKLTSTHPEVILEALTYANRFLKNSSYEPGKESVYTEGVEQRHQMLLDLVAPASERCLITAINACEHLLVFTEKDSSHYNQSLELWRSCMQQLENLHAPDAAQRYGELPKVLGYHRKEDLELRNECHTGFYRCNKLTSLAIEQTSILPALPQSSDQQLPVDPKLLLKHLL